VRWRGVRRGGAGAGLWTTRVANPSGLASVFLAGRRGAAGKGRMRRRSTWMPVTPLALSAVVLLAACQSSSEEPPASASPSGSVSSLPSASRTSSPAATASGSPTASSAVPAAAREKSEKGAEAFARYFFRQFNQAWTTPTPGLIAAVSDPGCQFCAKSEADARRLQKNGHRYSSDPLTILSIAAMPGAAPDNQLFLATNLRQNRVDIVDVSGSVISTDDKKKMSLVSGVIWTGDGWRMYEVESK
jgi:hypothetical protein